MDKKSKLKELLEKVSDSYPDFVSCGMSEAEESEEFVDKVIAYIEDNPDSSTSDIIKYETEEIFGIKPLA